MWPGTIDVSTISFEVVLPRDTNPVLESLDRRTWKKSPVMPVQLRRIPVALGVIESWNAAVGGPRAPATPTTNVSNCWVVWPLASVTTARKTYLPAERPEVLKAVPKLAMPTGARIGPPGATGARGAMGRTSGIAVHGPPPTGA